MFTHTTAHRAPGRHTFVSACDQRCNKMQVLYAGSWRPAIAEMNRIRLVLFNVNIIWTLFGSHA
jgi:hypothetical protein